jgi:hypothetical protein
LGEGEVEVEVDFSLSGDGAGAGARGAEGGEEDLRGGGEEGGPGFWVGGLEGMEFGRCGGEVAARVGMDSGVGGVGEEVR